MKKINPCEAQTLFPSESVYIGLGGNIGNPKDNFEKALELLENDPKNHIVNLSPLYQTPPWGIKDQPDFTNAVVEIRTSHLAESLLETCLEIEKKLKRIRVKKWEPRCLDLDILFFKNQTINKDNLTIPHPRMLERAFVLVPLCAIAPDLIIFGEKTKTALSKLNVDKIKKLPSLLAWHQK